MDVQVAQDDFGSIGLLENSRGELGDNFDRAVFTTSAAHSHPDREDTRGEEFVQFDRGRGQQLLRGRLAEYEVARRRVQPGQVVEVRQPVRVGQVWVDVDHDVGRGSVVGEAEGVTSTTGLSMASWR